jgi:putative IMPACT (imprinted ancient) family translation regulator
LEVKDTYNTIKFTSEEILHKEKIVNFRFCLSIQSEDEVKLIIDGLRKKHPMQVILLCLSNRHRHPSYRANDDGEPSNSAGMPIYGQILSFSLTNILGGSREFLAALN